MQPLFLYLFCVSILSCGFAQHNHLSADVKNPQSADGDCNCANVDDIQRELRAEQVKNQDLNQTISAILDEMEVMKRYIMGNEEKITDLQDDVVFVAEDVEKNSVLITNMSEDVASLISSDQLQTAQIASLASSDQHQALMMGALGIRGTWCSHITGPWDTVGTITYDRLTFSDTNMNITSTPLDINTGG